MPQYCPWVVIQMSIHLAPIRWLGVPVATVEQESSGSFEAVTRPNGTEVDSNSYDFWVALAVDPNYASEPNAAERSFRWTFSFPVTRRAERTVPGLSGPYRFQVRFPTDGAGSEEVVETGVFTVQ